MPDDSDAMHRDALTQAPVAAGQVSLPKVTILDTIRVVAEVVGPTLAKGVIIRRPRMVAMAERLDLDRRAVRSMQKLRDTYGLGPVLLRIPLRSQAVILAPQHVHRVLEHTPEPFAAASSEKRAALSHFEPKQALISHGPARADRRTFNEEVLETYRPVHHLAERFLAVLTEESEHMLDALGSRGELTWDVFAPTWFRIVRRIVLGDTARDDENVTDMLAQLRSDANWAFLRPKRTELREQFFDRLNSYLTRAESGCLAGVLAATPSNGVTAPTDQVPQWLFAFDSAGIATFRALALLASHPEHAARARQEIGAANQAIPGDLPYLRACVLESVRLWPTTPMILRQTTEETAWEHGTMPAGTGILIFAPFFHRDDERLPYANRFSPEIWLQERSIEDWPLIPFSEGPAACAGRNLALLMSSAMLAALLRNRQIRLQPPTRLESIQPLPGSLNPYSLRFMLSS